MCQAQLSAEKNFLTVAAWHLDLLIVEPDKGLIGECNTIVTGI